ncbi:hypothetical protein QFZ51_001233 [Chitinophaga sp. W3I9]|uniref:hypothetical protein n=1 Tax=unclassified Chitinophaga TaxID=2619133 RepID=UPI003D1D5345
MPWKMASYNIGLSQESSQSASCRLFVYSAAPKLAVLLPGGLRLISAKIPVHGVVHGYPWL